VVGLSEAVSVSHCGWGKGYWWPTGRAGARAPAVGRAAWRPGPDSPRGSVGVVRHAPAPVVDARELAHRIEARPGVGLLSGAGVLTIAEADKAPLLLLAALAIMRRSLQLSSRR